MGVRAAVAVLPAPRRRVALRFATIGVDQAGGRAARQADVRPVLERIAGFCRRVEDIGGNELVPAASGRPAGAVPRRNELGHDPSVHGDRNPFAGFKAANVAAQVVFQFPNASGSHSSIVAIYGHNRNPRRRPLYIGGAAATVTLAPRWMLKVPVTVSWA